ncbi:MAG: peptide chain release factor-like protein [Leptospira sp.]|nr:peptide chain release factor-like protein [Leptospira sp.]
MISFPISQEKQNQLFSKMKALGIREADLEESFTRSGGKGGQNVNKVSTAVRIRHKTSGIEVKCSIYRTQGLNRYKARAILCEKLEKNNLLNAEKTLPDIDKIRKQKARRKKKNEMKQNKKFKDIKKKEFLADIE